MNGEWDKRVFGGICGAVRGGWGEESCGTHFHFVCRFKIHYNKVWFGKLWERWWAENGFLPGACNSSRAHNDSPCLQFNWENVINWDSGTCKAARREKVSASACMCDGGGELPGNWCVYERDSIIGNDSSVSPLVSAYTASLIRALSFPRAHVCAPISARTYMYHVTSRLPGNCILPCQYEP